MWCPFTCVLQRVKTPIFVGNVTVSKNFYYLRASYDGRCPYMANRVASAWKSSSIDITKFLWPRSTGTFKEQTKKFLKLTIRETIRNTFEQILHIRVNADMKTTKRGIFQQNTPKPTRSRSKVMKMKQISPKSIHTIEKVKNQTFRQSQLVLS